MKKYTPSHEWVLVEGTTAVIGITDYAQQELGDIVYVELPQIGSDVKAGDPICVLESTKSAVDLYTPLSGEVIETNGVLKESPEKVNTSSEKEGWLFKLKISTPSEYASMMEEDAYQTFLKK